jgi:hypothetical protein
MHRLLRLERSEGLIMTDTILVIANSAGTVGNESALEKKNRITVSKLITPCNFAKDYAEEVRDKA